MNAATKLFSLDDKTALVTGASSGIGAEVSRSLVSAGANVLLVARRVDLLEKPQQELEAEFQEARCNRLVADLYDLTGDDWSALADKALKLFGKIDILCNVAGVNLREPWEKVSDDTWNRTVDLNLKVLFF